LCWSGSLGCGLGWAGRVLNPLVGLALLLLLEQDAAVHQLFILLLLLLLIGLLLLKNPLILLMLEGGLLSLRGCLGRLGRWRLRG
jgi:hypothetical protein